MTIHRFHVEQLTGAPTLILDGPEAHHAIKVLRVKVGEQVELFDGIGNAVRATIRSLGKREMDLELGAIEPKPLDHNNRLHFAVALPKGDRQRSVLEKLVELGVDTLTPLNTRYSVAEIDEGNRERLVRYALEACKQCERNRNLEVRSSASISQLNEQIAACIQNGGEAHILHPAIRLGEAEIASMKTSSLPTDPTEVLFIIGPEGGFTQDEVLQCVRSGAKLLSLGERILRVETAVSTAAVLGQLKLNSLQLP